MVDVRNLNRLIRRRRWSGRRTTMMTRNWNDKRNARSLLLLALLHQLLVLRLAILVLGSLRAINVVGVQLLVLCLLVLRQILPILALLCRQTLPLLADRLGQICLPLLLRWPLRCGSCLLLRLLAILAALASEKDKSVLWTLDVVLVALLRPAFDDVGAR